jgi:hypothetical protein
MKLKFLSPVDYNGKRYQPGDTGEVDRVAAASLFEVGAAEPFDVKGAAKAEAEAKEAAAAQAQAAADAAALAAGAGEKPVEA